MRDDVKDIKDKQEGLSDTIDKVIKFVHRIEVLSGDQSGKQSPNVKHSIRSISEANEDEESEKGTNRQQKTKW